MAYLINSENLKVLSQISSNVEDSILAPIIKDVQSVYIEPILGTSLFNRIIEGIDADDLNADEIILMDTYVTPCVVKGCEIEASLHLNLQLRNKTTGYNSDETMTSASQSQINQLQDNFRQKFEFYRQKLISYLRFNSDLYPEYLQYFSSPDSYFNCLTDGTEGILPDKGKPKVNIRFI